MDVLIGRPVTGRPVTGRPVTGRFVTGRLVTGRFVGVPYTYLTSTVQPTTEIKVLTCATYLDFSLV